MLLKYSLRKLIHTLFYCSLLAPSYVLGTTQISTCAELQHMSLDLNGEYELVNDINCDGQSFVPIGGSEASPFTGILKGAGYSIKNLNVYGKNYSYAGLFGVTKGATISQLTLENVQIVGKNYAGALIAVGHDTHISDVSSSGTIGVIQNLQDFSELPRGVMGGLVGYLLDKSTIIRGVSSAEIALQGVVRQNDISGGLVGLSVDSSLTDSHASGNIRGENSGGLVGGMIDGSITHCYATGSVDASTLTSGGPVGRMGGLVGYVSQSIGGKKIFVISRSYATGNVGTKYHSSFVTEIGGLLGNATSHYSKCPADFPDCLSKIENNFATGDVHASLANIGGLIGSAGYGYTTYTIMRIENNYSTGKVTSNSTSGSHNYYVNGLIGRAPEVLKKYIINGYWDMDTSGQKNSSGGYGRRTYQMYQKNNYTNWDFNTIWNINENQGYPFFIKK